jgi:hypothetical protein
MTTATLATSTTYTNIAKGRILSIRDYLVGEYLLGGSKTESVKNRANPNLPLLEVGVITALTKTASGSGGTDGTYNLIFTGGNPTTAATGTFVVVSGAVTTVTLTGNGQGYQSAPTVSLTNCPGLTGASVTATKAAPTYNTHSAVVRSSATAGYGFQTQVISDEDFTLLLVRKNATTAAQPNLMGMPPVGGSNLWGLREHDTNNYGSAGESSGTTGGCALPKPADGAIYFQALTHLPLQYTQFYQGASGSLTLAPNAASVATERRMLIQAGNMLQVYTQWLIGTGGLTDSIATNTCEVYFAAIYNRVLSQTELTQCYADITTYLGTLGVTLL